MADLKDLYQEAILDHYRKPRNFRKPAQANRQADGFNPLCGDNLTVFIQMENGRLADIGFLGSGCAISTASASMMTETLKGKTEAEARTLFERFQRLVSDQNSTSDPVDLGALAVFSGVREYPVRVKCATLAWHAMQAALTAQKGTVETD
jgi:nitrogen fixation protein NifU and related proteins